MMKPSPLPIALILAPIPTLVALGLPLPAGTSPTAGEWQDQDAYTEAAHPAAAPADVASIDAIVDAMYDVISGPAGERDWKRFESLFFPEFGRFMPVEPGPDGASIQNLTARDYRAQYGATFASNDFYETEVARKVERFGHLAHVFSTHATRSDPNADPVMRGISSFQLFNGGERWWILSIVSDWETTAHPIPAEYLK